MDQNLGLTDHELFGLSDERRGELAKTLMDTDVFGLRLIAPAVVDLKGGGTVPVVIGELATLKDLASFHVSDRAILTAVDLETGAVYVDFAFSQEDVAPRPKLGDAPISDGSGSLILDLDARERLDLRWAETTYLLTLLMLDKVSNRVKVRLGVGSGFRDEEVAKFLAAERARVGPPEVSPPPGEGLPSYAKLPESPEVPKDQGIVLAIERVVLVPGTWPLYGSFRLPLPRDRVVPQARRVAGGPEAVIAITLVITGSEDAVPIVETLHIPVADPVDPSNPQTEVTGYFALDLLSLADPSPQTCFVYAFSGEALAGPILTGLVSRDALPVV